MNKEIIQLFFRPYKNIYKVEQKTRAGGVNLSKNKHKSRQNLQNDKNKDDSDDSSVDYSKLETSYRKIGNAFSWTKKNIFTSKVNIVLLLAVLIFISIYVRMSPATLPITDQWAESTVLGNLQNNIAAQIKQQRPDLPQESINQLVQTEYSSFYAANKDQIDAQIATLSLQFKAELQNDQGQTHILGIDEYLWYSYAKWHDRNGYYGTEIVNGSPRFMLRYGRIGQGQLFIYVAYPINVLHSFLKIFNPARTIEQTAFYISIILMALVCIPAFFLGRKMFGTTGAFFATGIIAVSAAIVGRTLVGAPESDGYTILFPLLMTWLFFEALVSKKMLRTIIMSALAGLTGALFYFFWGGWWFTFLLLVGMAGVYIIYAGVLRKINKKPIFNIELLREALIPIIFFVSMLLFAILISFAAGDSTSTVAKNIITAPIQPLNYITGFKSASQGNIIGDDYALWPNVLRTVAELNPATLAQVVGSPGALTLGKFAIPLFWLGLLGIILLFFRYKENYMYPFYGAFLLAWLASTVYAGTTGLRFLVFVGIVIAFGLGSLVAYVVGPGLNAISGKMDKTGKTILTLTIILLFFFALLWTPIKTAKSIGDTAVPIFDDAWYKSMEPIANSPNKAITTSWWDYGHFFQAFSEQTVTFDGGDQGKRIYWVGKTLITKDEDEAIDIMKMLNCGEEEGSNLLKAYVTDEMKASQLIMKITRENKTEAEKTLKTVGLTTDQIDSVLKMTHCTDLYDMYFVTSSDMVGKATVWGHFGSWDFEKAYFYYHLKNLPLPDAIEHAKRDLGYEANKTREMYNQAKKIQNENDAASWISIYPGYVTQTPASCIKDTAKNTTITCNYNLVLDQQTGVNIVLTKGIINLTNERNSIFVMQAIDQRTGSILQQNTLIPAALVLDKNGELTRISLNNSNFGYDISVYENEGKYYSVISNEALSQSLFTKLFFMDGKYTTHFTKVSDITSFRGEKIIVWKVEP